MVQLAECDWKVDVERGPEWLYVRLHGPQDGNAEGAHVADRVWSLLQQQFTYRLVLEMDDVDILRSYLLGQLVLLQKRIAMHGGIMRLSGLSDSNRQVLRLSRLDQCFSQYDNRSDAVMGQPRKPR